MINISNNGFITVSRGDTFNIPLFINEGSRTDFLRYYVQENPQANIYMGVMEPNQKFEEAIIKKKFNYMSPINVYGDLMVRFESRDTEFLSPGKYFYSIKAEIIEFTHNINYNLESIDSTLVYGWIDSNKEISLGLLERILPSEIENKVVKAIAINNKTQELSCIYLKYIDEEDILGAYMKLDEDGSPIDLIEKIKLEDLLNNIKTTQNLPIVDTIVPPTDFFVID